MRAVRSFTVRPRLPEAISGLEQLAANLRWSWNRETRRLFSEVDPELWAATYHDPRMVLAAVPPARLDALAGDVGYVGRVRAAVDELDAAVTGPAWFGDRARDWPGGVIGYFSPEFGIAEAVPQYSGGLGVLAGDHLKAASDLGVPLVGVGLFYRHGYFRQSLSVDGWQQERFPDLDPYAMSMTLCVHPDGAPVEIDVDLAGDNCVAQIWRAQVGRTPLLLLDTDVEENPDHLRTITDRLYGGDTEHRLRQEILLGIGGVRALRALGIDATVFHTNEGHAGFLGFERIRTLMVEQQLDFEAALQAARASCVFTTHTPVPAGIDRFPRELIERYFGGFAAQLGLAIDDLVGLGHRPSDAPEERFNMAVMGMRLAERRNGVAALHGAVSREMFADLWPGVPVDEVPVGSITNGIHGPTWVSGEIAAELTASVGPDWPTATSWEALDGVDDERLWSAHRVGTRYLVDVARERLRESGLARGLSPAELAWTDGVLDPDALTICFARRFATYKRATLLLSQPERLRALLSDADRPVQFVFAGKAHPADDAGKELIRSIVNFSHDPQVRARLVFIDDYDIGISRALLHGADVWLNTPLRPMEACGTSGMKAVLNGALHCSVLDGWWAECFEPGLGWAIASAESVEDAERRDELEANSLFDLLESQIVPLFYDRPGGGLPTGWIRSMRASMTALGPYVSAHRMVRDYVEHLYRPARDAAAARCDDGFAGARELAGWRRHVIDSWPQVHIDDVETSESIADLTSERLVTARVALGALADSDVEVQLVHGAVGQANQLEGVEVLTMKPTGEPTDGHYLYAVELPLRRAGRRGLNVRVVPAHRLLEDPLELGCVAWAD